MHEDGGYVGGERSPLACKVVKKRKTARAKDQPTYVPFYGDIQRAWLDEGDEPFAHRLKFEVGNGLMMQGREQWLPHATISLQQMFHSEEYAPTEHETNVFARCLADFMRKLKDAPTGAEQQPVLLRGL